MSPAQVNQAVTPISPVYICPNFFKPNYSQSFRLVTIVFPSSRTLYTKGSDLPTNSGVTFLSPISSPSKIPSNPASLDEPPSLTLLSNSQPPTIHPEVAPSASTGSQFSISLLEANQPEITQEFPPFSSFLTFDRSYQGLITLNFSPINLLKDVNIAVNITRITHAEPNDASLFNTFNTVLSQSSVNGK